MTMATVYYKMSQRPRTRLQDSSRRRRRRLRRRILVDLYVITDPGWLTRTLARHHGYLKLKR